MNEAGKKMVKDAIDIQANRHSGVMIIGNDEQRAKQCAQAIGKAIKHLEDKYNCVFQPCVQVTPDGNIGSFLVHPKKPRGGPNNGG